MTNQDTQPEGMDERFNASFAHSWTRAEYLNFLKQEIATAEERGYVKRAREETNAKVYPLGHVLEEEQKIANAEKRMVERVIAEIPDSANTDIKWEDGKWVQYRSLHKLKPELAKYLTPREDK